MSWKNMASPKTKCLVSSKKNFHWLYWKIALAQRGVKRSQEREHTGRRCVQTFATGWHWRCPGLLLTIFFLLLSHGSEGLTKALEAQSSHKNVVHPVTLQLPLKVGALQCQASVHIMNEYVGKLLLPIEQKRKIKIWEGKEIKRGHWEEIWHT